MFPQVYESRQSVRLNLSNEERGQSRRPAPAGAAETWPRRGRSPGRIGRPGCSTRHAPRSPQTRPWNCGLPSPGSPGGRVIRSGEQPRGPAGSETNWESRHVQVPDDLEEHEAARALLHELGHILADGHGFHPPGASTAGCRGVQKLVADSVAFIAATRMGMDGSIYTWPHVASWAGSDPRARPEDIIHAVTDRITKAAARIITHLDITVLGIPPQPASTARRSPGRPPASPVPPHVGRVLKDAEHFYQAQLRRSWAPRYLASRGFDQATVARWRAGYAPPGWTTLLTHLRGLGHDDVSIQAAGLARMSSRGTLIDHFRDRVMLAIRDERGRTVGFIGRARPGADPRIPKYLNSPDSAVFKKGDVLFGLHEARDQLGQGAIPVLVEGPFDAMAVTASGEVAMQGSRPAARPSPSTRRKPWPGPRTFGTPAILVALDGDHAGQKGAIKAYEILRPHTGKTNAVMLPPGLDPAEVFQHDGPAALRAALHHVEPLARVVIDAHIDQWADRLDHAEGQLGAMRSAAARIAACSRRKPWTPSCTSPAASLSPCLTRSPRLVANPEVAAVVRILPAEMLCQIARTADRTSSEYSEVTAAVANAAAEHTNAPKDAGDGGTGFHVEADPARAQIQVAAADFIPNTVFAARPEPSGFRTTWRQRHPATKHNDGVSRTLTNGHGLC